MDFNHSAQAERYIAEVGAFVREEVEPREHEFLAAVAKDPWAVPPMIDELKAKAKSAGLWNLFIPKEIGRGPGLTNLEYAPLAEIMGRLNWASEVFNCNAPDTGNMEVLLRYGSPEQQERWLEPLLEGEIRSAFGMTEPQVASSDATNMEATAVVDGDEIVLNGRKWWSTGIGHPDCEVIIFMGLTDPDADAHRRHSMVLVPVDAPGVKVERMLTVFGYDEAPYGHAEVSYTDVRVPLENVIAGPGRGFEIAQGRLGPGRIHHCMRTIGLAERALEFGCRRGLERSAFGKPLVDLGGNRERVAEARLALEQARLLVLRAAWLIDTKGVKGARTEVSAIKAVVPKMALSVIDTAMQLHGAAGLSGDFPLAESYAWCRALRFIDGPDEVHLGVVARHELKRHEGSRA
ncbi:MAG: acyl-CoA dehydrogenase family protein [Segniliparus sp.]|uniref:acyl-CoA dehydrogenase family protein n=1 Tax=Segniliparus sp. TaxID=2804064 RepID=UPI003F309FE9